jgi:hypothetical protein
MARYYFHFRLGHMLGLDQHGTDCCSAEDAVLQAFVTALERFRLLSNRARHLASIEVDDHAGRFQFSVPLSAVASAGETGVGNIGNRMGG